MIKIAGLWELGWNNPLSESWLWSFVLREFGVMDWRMSPVTGILHNERHAGMNLTEFNDIREMLDSSPDLPRVFVDEFGECELQDFTHPEDCMYVFGNAGTSPMKIPGAKREQDFSVRIRTPNPSGVLWPHQCLLTVLYDRMKKGE
jgi:hypothetical protein